MTPVYVAIAAQIFVLLGATAAFFSKMGGLTAKVDHLITDVGNMKEKLDEVSDKTIALETTAKLKVAHK